MHGIVERIDGLAGLSELETAWLEEQYPPGTELRIYFLRGAAGVRSRYVAPQDERIALGASICGLGSWTAGMQTAWSGSTDTSELHAAERLEIGESLR